MPPREKKDRYPIEPVSIEDWVQPGDGTPKMQKHFHMEKMLIAIADGKMTEVESHQIANFLRTNGVVAHHLLRKLMPVEGAHLYFQKPVIVSDDVARKPVLSETGREVAREAVARLYAKELMNLLRSMSECSAETRKAIAEEIVTSIGTEEYIERRKQEGQRTAEYVKDNYTEKWSKCETYENLNAIMKEKAQELVFGSRAMLKEIVAALKEGWKNNPRTGEK